MAPTRDDSADESPTAKIFDEKALGSRTGATGETRLVPGSVLAERYRIVRFLSEGGMGAVYEAEDLQLRERVALKTVRPQMGSHPGTLDRFKREIQLARRVTHPNVCRIFEFGLHRLPDGRGSEGWAAQGRVSEGWAAQGGEVAFLTMELIEGETLAQRIKRLGRLAAMEALPMAEQMAAGLAAAHEAGVIHRDFKTSNVILSTTASGATRAVVSDFGLAQGAAVGEGKLDASDAVLGTLDYMAPEQIEAGPVNAAADQYAFGVVLYEMITGAKPFTGGSPLSAALKRLHQRAPRPRAVVPELDARWEAVILRCLEREPRDRFRGIDEAIKALRGEVVVRPRRASLSLTLVSLGVVSAVTAVSLFLWRPAPRESPSSGMEPRPGAPTKTRPAVAVLGFKNLSRQADLAWLSTALSEMFTTELAAGAGLRAIPGETVSRIRIELKLPEADSLARDTLSRLRSTLAADVVVLGSYVSVGSGRDARFRLDVRAQDVLSGEMLSSLSGTGSETELFGVVSSIGARLRQALGAAPLPPGEQAGAPAALTSNPEALRLYSEGLDKLRAFDALGARDRFTAAIRLEDGQALAHAALAEAWSLLGYEAHAREEARLALERSKSLSREQRLLIEARYHEMSRERDRAVEICRVLFGFFPDNVEYGLKLADALNSAGKPQDAFLTLASLRRLPAPASADPRIDLGEATVAQSLSDFRRELEAARRAATKGRDTGARLLVARARVLEAYAAGRLGLAADARAASDEARRLYREAGDRGGLAWALNRSGNVLYQQGRLVEANDLYKEAFGIFEEIGYQGSLTSLANNISEVLFVQGDLARAAEMLERVRSQSKDAADPRSPIVVPLNLANVAAERGHFASAKQSYEKALLACRDLGDQSLEASVKRHWADALANAGELRAAGILYREALAAHRRLVNPRYVAYALFGLGQVQRDEGDPDAARASQDEALAIRERLADRVGFAESRLAIGELDLDAGKAKSAEASAREALPVLGEEKVLDRQAEAGALLARALDKQQNPVAGREAIQLASDLAARSQRPRVRLSVGLVGAALLLPPSEARRRIETLGAEAARLGYKGVELEARLALLGLRSAKPGLGDARDQLERLRQVAAAGGFGRVAKDAARELESRQHSGAR